MWIKRSSYSIAGQVVAFRVTGDPVSANNGLFYVLSDHLGSTSLLVNSSGGTVTGSTTRYLPFGGYRCTAPSQSITDRDFTGQKENMELGLLYYQARFYVPYLNRFLSADTIVPDPTNPQAYNRYSYVENRPVNMVDPTGHRSCSSSQAATGDESCDQNITVTQEDWELFTDEMQSMLDSKFDGAIIFSPQGSYIPSNLAEMKVMQSAGKRVVNAMLDHVDAPNCGCNNLIMGAFGFDVGTDENGFPNPRTVDQKFYETYFDYDTELSNTTDIVIFAQRLQKEWLPGHAALMVVPDNADPENSIILQTNSPAAANGIYFTNIRNNSFFESSEDIIYMKQKWNVGPMKT
ncbi:MAG: RHS repeat-associated core domain-containing protein [Anaerolineae bacterium]|nr:RHS repeat-associated core domain-containing protein [Anaerolineae bacterium]